MKRAKKVVLYLQTEDGIGLIEGIKSINGTGERTQHLLPLRQISQGGLTLTCDGH